jgi:hypothetical protein
MALTPGDATAPRPALNQAVFARMVSPAGGVPWRRQRREGHASDPQMFQARAHALLAPFRASPHPCSWGADANLYTAEKAPNLAKLGWITRLPGARTRVTQVSTPALHGDTGPSRQARRRDQCRAWCPDRRAQRGRVVFAQAALARAEASVNHACQRDADAITSPLLHRHAKRVATPPQAHEAWAGGARPWRQHQGDSSALRDHHRAGNTGRPTAATPRHARAWQRPAQVRREAKRLEDAQPQTACVVLGTTIATEPLRDAEVLAGDTAPSQAEGGGRCRNDPWFCVSSLVVKNPRRLQGLLLGMTRARLVYAVAPRRLRRAGARHNATLPKHINPPTSRPTLRWVCHVLDGIERVRVTVDGQVRDLRTGVTEVTITILHLCGAQVCHV